MRRKLFRIYWKLRGVIAPSLRHSQSLYADILKTHVRPGDNWLDLGCGHQILPFWREDAEKEERELVAGCRNVVGLDYDFSSLQKHRSISNRVRGNVSQLPFRDQSFDLVTANMVIEHLAEPRVQFQEIYRILKPGGVFLFHTPNARGYATLLSKLVPETLKDRLIYILDGRREDDVFETHYQANTEQQITELSAMTGFEAKIKMTVSDAVFALVSPLAVFELVWIRLLMKNRFKAWRTDLIAALTKKEERAGNEFMRMSKSSQLKTTVREAV